MREQLYGYIVQVLLPIDTERANIAALKLKVLREQAKTLEAWALHYDEDRCMYENLVPEMMALLEHPSDHWGFTDSDEQFAETFLKWATPERLKECIECVNLVDPPKDMNWKKLKDGSTIIFAGGTADGGEPSGFGYGCLKDLDRFGMFDALGIE